MEYIKELTQKQKDAMPAYAQKWIDIGLKTGETDWGTFDKYMPICYEKAEIPYPKNIVRVNSPVVGALAASISEGIIKKYRKDAVRNVAGDAVYDAVRGAVRGAVGSAVGEAMGRAVDDAVYDAVDGAVRGAVRGAVGRAVGEAMGRAVGDAVYDAVDGAVRGAVYDAVGGVVHGAVSDAMGDAVYDAVYDAVDGIVGRVVGEVTSEAVGVSVDSVVKDAARGSFDLVKKLGIDISWNYWLGGQFWVGGWYWGVAHVNFFFDVCGLRLSEDIMERAEAYRKVCESVNYIWPNRDFVIVCARPTEINRDNQGRLHSTAGKAIFYPDGWGLYLLHGVKFEEDLWSKVVSGKMSFSEILKIENTEQRLQALRYNPNALLSEKPKLLNKTKRNNELYVIENSEVNRIYEEDKVYFLRFLDPSKDEGNNWLIKPVNPDICAVTTNPDEVMAYTYYSQLYKDTEITTDKVRECMNFYKQLKVEA